MTSLTVSQNQPAETQPSVPKEKYRVTNWPEHEKALRQRGDITVWKEQNWQKRGT